MDSSALVKLVVAEPESPELIDWLNGHSDHTLATSIVGHIELGRAASRLGATAVAAARRILSSVDTLILTEAVAATAANIGPPELRTLDAIHLATAYIHRTAVSLVCAYDRRLLEAARLLQLPIAAPGQQPE
jgi:predicted nucleic acid-binding protein